MMAPARASSANIAVPPVRIHAEALLNVPGHIMPTEKPHIAQPIRATKIAHKDIITDHKMHSEFYQIGDEAAEIINAAKREGRRVIAVGTTSVRTLESVGADDGTVRACSGNTEIFLYPPYQMKCVDALITNFHLPESTLLMLVSALMGQKEALAAYREHPAHLAAKKHFHHFLDKRVAADYEV